MGSIVLHYFLRKLEQMGIYSSGLQRMSTSASGTSKSAGRGLENLRSEASASQHVGFPS